MNQNIEKRISSAWRPEFRRKATFFEKSATKSDFDHAPSHVSMTTSSGQVPGSSDQKSCKNLNDQPLIEHVMILILCFECLVKSANATMAMDADTLSSAENPHMQNLASP